MYPGGVPNTLNPVHEQWDYPNVWPPMQHILVVGLDNLKDARTTDLAYKWATKWVQSNFLGWDGHKEMYEKVSASLHFLKRNQLLISRPFYFISPVLVSAAGISWCRWRVCGAAGLWLVQWRGDGSDEHVWR